MGRVLRPTVDVRLDCGGLTWKTKALIDTGASLCIFARGAGEALDVDFDGWSDRAQTVIIAGASRAVVPAYVDVTLPPFEDLHWTMEAWFFVEDWPVPFGILGSAGFLDHWAVSFNYYGSFFVVEPIDDFEQRIPVDEFEAFQTRYEDDWMGPANT